MILEKEPFVSVVLPTYNRADKLVRAIRSVLQQTWQNFELIIVDDCSTDDTEAVVSSFREDRIIYLRNEKNSGACASRNNGVKRASYELITFLDSDDAFKRDYLEAHIENLRISEIPLEQFGLQFCQYHFHEKGEKVLKPGRPLDLSTQESTLSTLLFRNFITTQTIMTTKTVLTAVGGFDEDLGAFQDWDLAIRIAEKYRVIYLQKPLVDVYLSDDSITLNHKKRRLALIYLLNKYNNRGLIDRDLNYLLTYRIVRYAQVNKLKPEPGYTFGSLFKLKPFDARTYFALAKGLTK
jgi:glycosyltransferase involved in cell wall biosynthesis